MNLNRFVVVRALMILEKKDRYKSVVLVLIQIGLSFIDLLGVAVFGILGALAVNGTASRSPGNRVSKVLEFLNIGNLSLQKQALTLGLLASGLLILKTALSIWLTRRTMFFLSRRGAKLTQALINKLLSQSLQEVQKRSMQENVYALTGGVGNITNGILGTSISILSDFSLLLIMLAGLFVIDPIISLISLILFGGIAIILYKLLHAKAQKLGNNQAKLTIRGIEMIQEVIGSYREAIVGGRRSYYVDQIGKHQYELAANSAEMGFMPNISKYVLEVSVVLSTLVISGIQFTRTDAAHSVAVLAVFLAASTRIAPAILRIQQSAIQIRSTASVAEPTLKMIEEYSIDSHSSNLLKVSKFKTNHESFESNIEIRNVGFKYEENSNPTLQNINMDISNGQLIAIVGKSGVGKTTLVDLILGVLKPTSGDIKIGGFTPLETINTFPGAIAYVPQDVQISNGTIRSNICLGFETSEIKDELIWSALEKAQLSDFVSSLPARLDSKIGDRGSKLSGGQRQRLGIARALITDPKLLVLDEATSALDGETELNISEAIMKLRGQVTVILIAHRLSSIRDCDQIFYLEAGEIKSKGNFEEIRQLVPDFNKQAELMGL
ncbi:MAG: ABC transporter ATP-binding protein [Actinomycetes bacterium]